jgi:hypothetical protein
VCDSNCNVVASCLLYYRYLDEEWGSMVQPLWKLEATNSPEGRGSLLSKCLSRPFLLVMQYVKGIDLEHISSSTVELLKVKLYSIVYSDWSRIQKYYRKLDV